MNPLVKLLIRIAIVFVVIFIAMQPFNWFCGISQKCSPFYLSYLIPKREGFDQFDFHFDVTNYRQNLSLTVVEKSLTTVINRKNTIHYRAKNLSKKTIYIRSKLNIEPSSFEQHLKIYDCLCTKVYKLKRGQEVDLKMTFEIKGSAEDDRTAKPYKNTKKPVLINYLIK